MSHVIRGEELSDALQDLERSLETPVVPGELESWIESVQSTLEQTDQVLQRWLRVERARQLESIMSEDSEEARRVTQIKEGDQESLAASLKVHQLLNALTGAADEAEGKEFGTEDEVQQVVDAGLAFVIQVRKQEVATETWLNEALNRDRGVGD